MVPWVEKDLPIEGSPYNRFFGHSVAMSDGGNRIAISDPGAHQAYTSDHKTVGAVDVFFWDFTLNEWDFSGRIEGENNYQNFGTSIDISSTGEFLIIGSAIAGSRSKAEVYQWGGSHYALRDSPLYGSIASNVAGTSVSISGDGNVAIVAGHQQEGNVQVFEWIDGHWVGSMDIQDGGMQSEIFGSSVSLSQDASRLAIADRLYDHSHVDCGLVRVYEQFATSIENEGSSESFHVYPNPCSGHLTIEQTKLKIGNICVKNMQGMVLHEFKLKESRVELNLDLPDGMYILESIGEDVKLERTPIVLVNSH